MTKTESKIREGVKNYLIWSGQYKGSISGAEIDQATKIVLNK